MEISEKNQSFVYHFGEMGSKWGFNRTVGQIYALLVITEKPVSANDIADALSISRGNVSMGIKELQSWQLVQVSHIPGDRKEYYSAIGSVMDMANKVFDERRKREVDPTLSLLRNLLLEKTNTDGEEYAQKRMKEIYDLLEMMTNWAIELQKLTPTQLSTLMKLGSGITKILSVKKTLFSKNKE